MAKTKKTKSVKSQNITTNKNSSNLLSQIKWGESYTSLLLGAVVVVVALVLVFSFLRDRNSLLKQTSSTSTQNEQAIQQKLTQTPKSYTVKSEDDLWHISESLYGSGYNWVDLANANKLFDPSMLYSGTVLVVPNVKSVVVAQNINQDQTQITQSENKITGATYKIQKGDDLWDVAVRAYGDGYKWVEIAKANNLVNPDVIHSDNVLKLPR